MENETTMLRQAHNPLVSAAETCFLLASQLRQQSSAPNFAQLYPAACDAVSTFEKQASSDGYSKATIDNAAFLLSALIDDIILSSDWGQNSVWKQENLINAFQKNRAIDISFFRVLNRAIEDPFDNIDFLELAYICLSLGYQGSYRNTTDQDKLANITDRLYNIIRSERGEISRKLCDDIKNKKSESSPLRLPPVWVTILIAGIILFSIYIPYNKKLNHYTTAAIQTIKQATQTDT